MAPIARRGVWLIANTKWILKLMLSGNELHGGMHIHSSSIPTSMMGEGMSCTAVCIYTQFHSHFHDGRGNELHGGMHIHSSSIPTSMMGEGMSCTAVCIYTQFHSHFHDGSGNGTGVYLHTTVQLYYATTIIKTVSTLLWHRSDKQMYGVYQSKVRTVLIYKYREFKLTASHKPQI